MYRNRDFPSCDCLRWCWSPTSRRRTGMRQTPRPRPARNRDRLLVDNRVRTPGTSDDGYARILAKEMPAEGSRSSLAARPKRRGGRGRVWKPSRRGRRSSSISPCKIPRGRASWRAEPGPGLDGASPSPDHERSFGAIGNRVAHTEYQPEVSARGSPSESSRTLRVSRICLGGCGPRLLGCPARLALEVVFPERGCQTGQGPEIHYRVTDIKDHHKIRRFHFLLCGLCTTNPENLVRRKTS